jgi:hypothetical protein
MTAKKKLTDKEIDAVFIPKENKTKPVKKSTVKSKEIQKIEKIVKKEIEIKPPKKDENLTPEIIYTEKEKVYYDLNYFYLNRLVKRFLYFISYKHYEEWFNKTFNKTKVDLPKKVIDENEDLYEDDFINKLSDNQLKKLQDKLDKIKWLER